MLGRLQSEIIAFNINLLSVTKLNCFKDDKNSLVFLFCGM